ncbi:MAG: MBL fold metallo-hydrolase [Clostridia bacterium]|nr:MBL fold metallo-hydrolase [Clostridia bacterium]
MTQKEYCFATGEVDLASDADRIYFFNTGSADAVLLESCGRFALIDGGEDSDNPRGFSELAFEGTEEYVAESVRRIAGRKNGEAVIEFVLGTHSHSDHIGGLDTLVLSKGVTVKRVLIKKYDESRIIPYEVTRWDNKEVYEQLVSACLSKNIPVIHNIPEEKFSFGNFMLKFCNASDVDCSHLVGENENAVGLLVEKGKLRAFLAADINNHIGCEDKLAYELGRVNLLKVGHHGYNGSTELSFVQTLRPEIAVITNRKGGASPEVVKNLESIGALVLETGAYGGITAQFDAEEITLYKNLDKTLGQNENIEKHK